MVITVRGTSNNENKSAHVVALMSTMGAIKKSRKTLVVQFNAKGPSVEDILIGRRNAEVNIKDLGFTDEDSGVDALMMRVDSMRIQKEHFDACTSSVMDEDNLLDIAGPSKREDIEDALLRNEENIDTLITQAKDVYDDIYIYANGRNEDLMKVINKYSDLVITCIRQGNKEEVVGIDNSKNLYVVTNYDRDSSYSTRLLKKEYKSNNMVYIPYSCEFKDAYNDGNVLNFIAKNEKISDSDVNFMVIHAIELMIDRYLEDKSEPEKDPELPEDLDMEEEEDIDELEDFEEPDVEIVEEKKGLSKKNKKIVRPIRRIEDVIEEYDEIDDEFEEEEEEDEDIDEDIEIIDDFEEEDDDDEDDIPPLPAITDMPKASKKEKKKMFGKHRAPKEEEPVKKAPTPMPTPTPAPVSNRSDTWECTCGEINPIKAKFCMECGAPKPAPTEWICPACGEVNPPKAKFCMECGHSNK